MQYITHHEIFNLICQVAHGIHNLNFVCSNAQCTFLGIISIIYWNTSSKENFTTTIRRAMLFETQCWGESFDEKVNSSL